ncbi:hypothetical protein ACTSKR_07615 [Chitinibacteraceae bacterium HSL-7]
MEIKEAIKLLENWGGWTRGSRGGQTGWASSMYMSPEEKMAAGGACRLAAWNEADAHRVDAVIAALRVTGRGLFASLLEKHYVWRANPRMVCRRERLVLADYDWHLERAMRVFVTEFGVWKLTPVESIRKNALDNSIRQSGVGRTLRA